jgi:hypothetical protein
MAQHCCLFTYYTVLSGQICSVRPVPLVEAERRRSGVRKLRIAALSCAETAMRRLCRSDVPRHLRHVPCLA